MNKYQSLLCGSGEAVVCLGPGPSRLIVCLIFPLEYFPRRNPGMSMIRVILALHFHMGSLSYWMWMGLENGMACTCCEEAHLLRRIGSIPLPKKRLLVKEEAGIGFPKCSLAIFPQDARIQI
nr:hypothetical protein [Zea mays]